MTQTAPERIYNWRNSQLSIARFYGGFKAYGHEYFIADGEDGQPLVRADVLAREAKKRKDLAKRAKQKPEDKQKNIF